MTYVFNPSATSNRVPVIEFGDCTAVKSSEEPITNFIVNDEEGSKRKRTAVKKANVSKRVKKVLKPPLPGSVIDLTQLENENLDSPIVKQVATTLLRICKRDARKSTGYLMINLSDSSMKIIQDYSTVVVDAPVSARNSNIHNDSEVEEYEWVDEIVKSENLKMLQ